MSAATVALVWLVRPAATAGAEAFSSGQAAMGVPVATVLVALLVMVVGVGRRVCCRCWGSVGPAGTADRGSRPVMVGLVEMGVCWRCWPGVGSAALVDRVSVGGLVVVAVGVTCSRFPGHRG